MGGIKLCDLHGKATVIKTVWDWYKIRHINNGTEWEHRNKPSIYIQIIFKSEPETVNGEKTVLQ